jgi:hypothetical protein
VNACPACGRAFDVIPVPFPVEPLWSMASASLLVPMKPATLKRWLTRHRHDPGLGPAQYTGSWGRRHRMLTGPDIKYIRSIVVSNQWRRPR